MQRATLIAVAAALCGCESSSSSWFPPSMTVGIRQDIRAYAMTREQARAATLSYCETWLEREPDKPRLPYRQTFLRAMDGDLNALRLILTDRNYHTGDNEAWDDAQWPLLNAVGDERFAACLSRLSREDRKYYSGAVMRPYVPEPQLEAYARKHFPHVWAIHEREHKRAKHSLEPTAGRRDARI